MHQLPLPLVIGLFASGYLFVGALLGYLKQDRFYARCEGCEGVDDLLCMLGAVLLWPLLFPFGDNSRD